MSPKDIQLYLPIEGLEIIPENARQGVLSDNSIIQESKDLLWTPTGYGEIEQKIISLVKAQIKEEDTTLPDVSFTVERLAEYLEVKKSWIYNYYPSIINNLAKVAYQLPFELDNELAYGAMPFFSAVACLKGKFFFKINPLLSPLLLPSNLWSKVGKKIYKNKKNKFEVAKYNAKNHISLSGKYAVKLYPIFSSHLFKNTTLNITLSELRSLVSVEGKFKEYREFNRNVLTPSIKEINDKSDIFVNYDSIKTGNKISNFKFYVFHKPKEIEINKTKQKLVLYGISIESIDYIFNTLNITVENVLFHIEKIEKSILKGKHFDSIPNYLYQSIINNWGSRTQKEIDGEEEKIIEKRKEIKRTKLINNITELKNEYEESIKQKYNLFIQNNDINILQEEFFESLSGFAQSRLKSILNKNKELTFRELLENYLDMKALFCWFVRNKLDSQMSFKEFLKERGIEVSQMFLDENLLI